MQIGEITEPKIDQAGPVPNGEFTYVDISSVDNNSKRIVEPKRLPADSAPSRARQRLHRPRGRGRGRRQSEARAGPAAGGLDESIRDVNLHLAARRPMEPAPLLNASALVQKLWNYSNVLRDDGMSNGDYVGRFPRT